MAQSITPQDLQNLRASSTTVDLLDVRTPVEHAQIHVPGVVLAPLETLDVASVLQARGDRKNEPLYILCAKGGRARQAADKFVAAGFNNAIVVEGGTEAWAAAGLPVNRGASSVIGLDRQVRIAAGLIILTGVILGYTVHSNWFALSGFVGAGLVFAGITDTCGLAMLIARMPWNQCCSGKSCCCCS